MLGINIVELEKEHSAIDTVRHNNRTGGGIMKVQGSVAQLTCQMAKNFRQVTNLTKALTDLFHLSIHLQCIINPNKCQLESLLTAKFCVILLIIGSCRQREYKILCNIAIKTF